MSHPAGWDQNLPGRGYRGGLCLSRYGLFSLYFFVIKNPPLREGRR